MPTRPTQGMPSEEQPSRQLLHQEGQLARPTSHKVMSSRKLSQLPVASPPRHSQSHTGAKAEEMRDHRQSLQDESV